MNAIELWSGRIARFQTWTLAVLLLAHSSGAAPLQLLSARSSAVPLSSGGDGNSVASVMSSDGRFILFTSSANDLVPNGYNQFFMNVYLRDRMSNTTVLVSANLNGTTGGNGNSIGGITSTNFRWVVFQSDASDLVHGDTNNTTDIFVRDMQTGSNILVSVATNGGPANGPSTDPTITPDGRYVVFSSTATNLVLGDTNGIADIFVRDLVNQTTTLVSVGATKPPVLSSLIIPTGPPAITPDGRFVAFFSTARGMAAGVASSSTGEVYVRDLMASNTLWVSSNAVAAAQLSGSANYISYHPRISDDGRFVAFKTSSADNTKTGGVLRYDANSNSLLLVTSNALPQFYNDDVYGPEMTPNGRFIASVIGAIPTLGQPIHSGLYLFDDQVGSNVLVSVRQDGSSSTNFDSNTPVLSPDGRFVAFVSNETNLVSNAITNGYHIYLRDMNAGATALVDAGTNGSAVADQYGTAPNLSSDGRWVSFTSPDANLVSGDQNRVLDVFLRDMTSGTNDMVSRRSPSVTSIAGNGISYASQLSITPNGRWVVFSSTADDLVTNDSNGNQDIFVRDLALGSTTIASVGVDGNAAVGGISANPVISSNGQFVAFFSMAANLVAGHSNAWGEIYVRDLVAGTNAVVSVSANGVSVANGMSTAPAMSQDGRYVTFSSMANNLVSPSAPFGRTNTFWRDTASGVTLLVSTNNAGGFRPSISADGRYVAYSFSSSNTVAVWDSNTQTNIYVAPSSGVTGAAISPDGTGLLYQQSSVLTSTGAVSVSDIVLRSNVLSLFSTTQIQSPAQWSADGRFFTVVGRSNVVTGPFTNNQIYFGDRQAGTIALVSTPDHINGGTGPSDSPTISGNGRYIVYRSTATNIAPGAIFDSNLILYDRTTGSNTVLNVGAQASDWSSRIARPLLDAAGQTVTFQSMQSGLAPGDLNRAPDVFAGQPAVAVDTDGDGIPDWWMIKYFGHAIASAGDHSQPQDDADGDGLSNLQEFLSGTNPTDAQSFLKVQISPPNSSSNTATLNWPSVPGKSYQVQYKANLEDPNWSNYGPAIVATSAISITVPLTSPSGFYRVIAVN